MQRESVVSAALCRACCAAAIALAAGGAQAACELGATGDTIAFGPYQPLTFGGKLASAAVDSSTSLTVTCNGNLPVLTCLALEPVAYTIRIGRGRSNDASARRMPGSNGGTDMNYNLYLDATRLLPWGDGTSGGVATGSIPGCGSRTHTVYGRVPGGQNGLRPGSFSEQLLVTLEYLP